MRYFVIGDDGQKYGPADVATLQTWIAEGRLLPTQQLEDESSGLRQAAAAVNGLRFPTAAAPGAPGAPGGPPTGSPYGQAPGGSPYSRPVNTQVSGDDGNTDATLGWVFGGLGAVVCCFWWVLLPIGLIFSYKAVNKGNPRGNSARVFCWVFLGLYLTITVIVQVMRFTGNWPTPGTVPIR